MWMFGVGAPRSASGSTRGASGGSESRDGVVVMISSFVVPPTAEEAFLGWWRLAKPFIAAQPGFVSARLHRSLDAREGSKYVNILEWRGAAAYRDALAKFWSSGPPPIPGVDWRPQLYEIVETI